jgi:protease I
VAKSNLSCMWKNWRKAQFLIMSTKSVLILLPAASFDVSEASAPWSVVTAAGYKVVFATPHGKPSNPDFRMINGEGFGMFKSLLIVPSYVVNIFEKMSQSEEYKNPISHAEVNVDNYLGLVVPGGHEKVGMRPFLESQVAQSVVSKFFEPNKPVGAICHGMVLLARSKSKTGNSVLYGRTVTGLTCYLEYFAYWLTFWSLGDYFLTYKVTVEEEVKSVLKRKSDFVVKNPFLIPSRDAPGNLTGFVVRDGLLVTSRAFGDAFTFAEAFLQTLKDYEKSLAVKK